MSDAFYGACGCEGCNECKPAYNASNDPIADEVEQS